ncbi:lytic murein transglycosylase [Nioella sediminis]|jgi:lytic murein transglycosylase|uniref:lytic murein transglycosylase n=1 Tax=Nioella sediminis TaxID=1912092 RepID=UPI0008FD1D38|nr:lytic murein transglycosylase [Nioella sediminis]TBX20470.1 murein transglycosylase [Roseovarius sp. JS7-11]
MLTPRLFLTAILVLAASAAGATPTATMRPLPRPAEDSLQSVTPSGLAVDVSLRPAMRMVTLAARPETPLAEPVSSAGFRAWVSEFSRRARAEGIGQQTLDRAFAGVTLNERVIERDRNQSEFSRTLWDYLDSAASDTRIANGRTALREHRDTLDAIERRYGVEAEIVAAVWGLESAYGSFRGSVPIIEAMATLAYEGRRAEFFETELLAALRILQAGDIAPDHMQGSWAGAMGHTQFMPTSFLAHAVDFTGDGRRDIWGDDPADALASTARYLSENGWTHGQPWALEVELPDDFDFSQSGELIQRDAAHWNAMGVRLARGGGLVPEHGPSSILLPAGHTGVALVIYENFHVIETYNPADAYVIGVGHLADRIGGGPAFRGGWPRQDRALTNDERFELQRRLTAAGFSTERIDGIVGPLTIQAVREYQAAEGLVPDGYASEALLRRLRRG